MALLEALADNATTDERANAALALLGDEDEDEGASQTPSDADLGIDLAPETASEDDTDKTTETDAVEPGASSAIEAPETFSAELKERFKALPPDLQQTLAQWESERNRGVSTKLEEAANLRKALEPELAAAKTQRQQLALQLENAIQLSQQFNPVIAEGLKRTQADWLNLARNDKARYVEEWAEFQGAMNQVQAAQAQLQQLRQTEQAERGQAHQQTVAQQMTLLAQAMPELVDAKTKQLDPVKAKAFAVEVDTTLRAHGFNADEIAGLSDHRMLKVVRDAMAWRKGDAQRKAAAAKQTVVVPKVVRPGSGNAGASEARSKALINRARNAGSTSDQADAIAAMLRD